MMDLNLDTGRPNQVLTEVTLNIGRPPDHWPTLCRTHKSDNTWHFSRSEINIRFHEIIVNNICQPTVIMK